MSHGIREEDRGIVWGDTWHRLPQYIQQETPVTVEQARSVLVFPLAKIPLVRRDDGAQVDAYCIVRTDTNRVLVPHVGVKFEPLDNSVLVNTLETRLLKIYPELVIESVGTLFGGQTTFVNVVLEKFHVKGDESPTLTRLMYYNPMGIGGHKIGVHNIRVVCNNTLRMASAQAAANESLQVVPHTQSAATTIADRLFDLAETKLFAANFNARVETLVDMPIRTDEELTKLLDFILPEPNEAEEPDTPEENAVRETVKRRQNTTREAVKELYEKGIEGIAPEYQRTRYALLQAITYTADNPAKVAKSLDAAFVIWDGLTGRRATLKEHALTILLTA